MSHRPDPGDLEQWASERAPELIARAEAAAVAVLRDALVAASLADTGLARPQDVPPSQPDLSEADPGKDPWAPKPRAAQPPRDARELLWAYCVLHDGGRAPSGVDGITERRIESIEAGHLTALVSRVPATEFSAEPLTHNLNDIAWLERVARGHEAVLDAALAQATIVPLRMCTIFENEAGVREMLDQQRESLAGALDALEGRLEWSVKVLVDRNRLMDAARPQHSEDDEVAAAGEGGAYLQRRRAERGAREAASHLAADTAQQVHARLQDWAIDARTCPPQNRELSGHEGEMVLNAAYLVERDRTDELRQIIAELEEHHRGLGARVELTGPWPPYNFVPAGHTSALA
ncbi:MAG TPA: GvpL/GvpF family gas vesicle protein [Solirubrobacteraceae bacterium]|nr:GvpL/GvpF family gas vesicle protein [Solirubrobacteraceae bacterium]